MDVHASPAELPELKDFLGAFQVRFRRPEGGKPRSGTRRVCSRSCLASTAIRWRRPYPAPLNNGCRSCSPPCSGMKRNRQRVERVSAGVTLGDGVLVLDDTGVPKQGGRRWGWRVSTRALWGRSIIVRLR